jgi:hypothetical protein
VCVRVGEVSEREGPDRVLPVLDQTDQVGPGLGQTIMGQANGPAHLTIWPFFYLTNNPINKSSHGEIQI